MLPQQLALKRTGTNETLFDADADSLVPVMSIGIYVT